MARFGIGQAVRRVEDERFLKGAGNYVGDIALPGELCGVAVYSTEAHARIKRVDASKAQAAPGQGRVGDLPDTATVAVDPALGGTHVPTRLLVLLHDDLVVVHPGSRRPPPGRGTPSCPEALRRRARRPSAAARSRRRREPRSVV